MTSNVLEIRHAGKPLSPPSDANISGPGAQVHNTSARENEDIENVQHPLAGIVLCCTAIPPENRAALAESAQPLGATHALDLTAAVTHLLVGHWDTAKYAFVAKARPDVRVLDPGFINAAKDLWMSGTDHVDVDALELAHTYPALKGARVCVTGFGDADERRRIESRVRAAGGDYSGDLTREVTHLVAAKPEGAKYAAARQWKIHVVVLRWLEESLQRGMILDGTRYDPLLPSQEIGRGAWVLPSKASHLSVTAVKRKREAGDGSGSSRKLRRAASAKFSQDDVKIWGEIMHCNVDEVPKRNAWEEPVTGDVSAPPAPQIDKPLRKAASTGSIGQTSNRTNQISVGSPRGGKMFAGVTMYIQGFGARETMVLERLLPAQAATIYTESSEFAAAHAMMTRNNAFPRDTSPSSAWLIVVPHTQFPPRISETLLSLHPKPFVVTEFYIEECIHRGCCLPPDISPLHVPIPRDLKDFSKLTLCITGFTDIELLHLSKTIKRLGADFTEILRKTASVLLCRPLHGKDVEKLTALERVKVEQEIEARDKVRFARAHSIPIVWSAWLWVCMEAGRVISWDKWEIGVRSAGKNGDSTHEHNPNRLTSMASHAEGESTIEKVAAVEAASKDLPKADVLKDPAPAAQGISETKESPLAAALSSLLAARSRSTSFRRNSNPVSADGSASTSFAIDAEVKTNKGGRRRRTLLGRAPSTASLRSVGSVGSANTDGVGTPLSIDGPVVDGGETASKTFAEEIRDRLQHEVEGGTRDHADQREPPLTQVGYEDLPARHWRQKMERRMAGQAAGDPSTEMDTEMDPEETDDQGVRIERQRVIRDEGERHDGAQDDQMGLGRRILRKRG